MINRAVLVGRLTKDVVIKYTTNGTAVGSFTIAVSRPFKNSQGERETDFINCTMWRKTAENFAKFTHKGSLVGVDGRIQTRTYDNAQGQTVYVTELVADEFSLLEPKGSSGGPSQQNPPQQHQKPVDQGEPITVSDDDLPF